MTSPGLVVFSDDWGRHPSSCQHLVRELLGSVEVLWVNTIGTRAPSLSWSTLKRGVEKLSQWTRQDRESSAPLPEHLRVVNPRMWPWMSGRVDQWINRKLLAGPLAKRASELPAPVIGLTTLPIVADWIGLLPCSRWVYYCVDDFGLWPGLDHEPLRKLERRLLGQVDAVVAVSQTLQDKLRGQGVESTLLTHGVDLSFWQVPSAPAPDSVARLEKPLIVFWGVVDARMDLSWVQALSAGLERGTVLLVGPQSDPDPRLLVLPRVRYVPPVLFETLPAIAQAADVLVMPYADLPVTRAMQPLKLKEFLATGRPTVVRRLPATIEWGDCLDLADSPDSFVAAVNRCLRNGVTPEQHAARRRLASESWKAKAEILASVLMEGVA